MVTPVKFNEHTGYGHQDTKKRKVSWMNKTFRPAINH